MAGRELISSSRRPTPDSAKIFPPSSAPQWPVGAFGTQCAVDEVGIWNRALTASEITALGSGGKRIPEASSFAWAGAGLAVAGLAAVRRRRAKR